jgi:hypothetical protein
MEGGEPGDGATHPSCAGEVAGAPSSHQCRTRQYHQSSRLGVFSLQGRTSNTFNLLRRISSLQRNSCGRSRKSPASTSPATAASSSEGVGRGRGEEPRSAHGGDGGGRWREISPPTARVRGRHGRGSPLALYSFPYSERDMIHIPLSQTVPYELFL